MGNTDKPRPVSRRGLAAKAALALVALLAISASSAASQDSKASPAWYADKFRKLGFTVYDKAATPPDFAALSLDGKKVRLGDLRGKVVLLNFWATWCPPCREEMPALDALWRSMKDKDFAIMGLSGGESIEVVRSFVKAEGYTYPIYADPSNQVAASYGVRAIPTTLILDKSGNVLASKIGGAPFDSSDSQALFSALAAR